MTRLALQEIQEHFADAVSRVTDTGERIVVESQGKDLAVLVSLADLVLLEELEDRLDLATKMPPAQLAEAQKLAREWKPTTQGK